MFDITFNPPQNFAAYRQSELDTARVSTFQGMEAFPYISKRFALERFLGLTEEEINKNEKLWGEENTEAQDADPSGSDLRNIGVSTGDFDADIDTNDEIEDQENLDDLGDLDVAGPVGGQASTAAGSAEGAGEVGPVS